MTNELTPQGKLEGIWIDISLFTSETPTEDLKKIRDLIGYEKRTSFAVDPRYYCKSCNKDLENQGSEIKLCDCINFPIDT